MFPIAADDGMLFSLLGETTDAPTDFVHAHLSTMGFGDLPRNGSFVLGSMAFGGGVTGDLKQVLGITEREASEIAEALVMRGYLELKIDPAERRRVTISLTSRGRAAVLALWDCLRAARWRGFEYRPGDIVVSTPAKSGTTWMQMICALLIFRTPDLPVPLRHMSPWLDDMARPRDEVFGLLAEQPHRRVIKTHTPLSDIPADPRVTYIVVARHPLDSAISLYHQGGNIDRTRNTEGSDVDRLPPREWLLQWIEESPARQEEPTSLPGVMWHLSDAWIRRTDSGVILTHYEDLSADLRGEMARLAERLGIDVPDAALDDLAAAAGFDRMRADADRLQPLGTARSTTAFFRRGGSGSGVRLLADDELRRYRDRASALAPADLLDWLHRQ